MQASANATDLGLKIWTNPQNGLELRVVAVKAYKDDGLRFVVHKETATSSKYVFGVRAHDCRVAS